MHGKMNTKRVKLRRQNDNVAQERAFVETMVWQRVRVGYESVQPAGLWASRCRERGRERERGILSKTSREMR